VVVTVLAVRHADIDLPRVSEDPALNAAGRQRAAALARLAGDSGVSTIFTSEFLRTKQTVQPLADLLGVTPQLSPEPSALAVRARSEESGAVLLIAGHSNTVPDFLAALGAEASPAIDEDEFDNLFVLTTRPHNGAELLHLRYGAAR
jgi:phosphohistidine phosphatase SixA